MIFAFLLSLKSPNFRPTIEMIFARKNKKFHILFFIQQKLNSFELNSFLNIKENLNVSHIGEG